MIARHDWVKPLLKVLRGLWTDAYLVGWVSAGGVLSHHGVAVGVAKADTPVVSMGVDWGGWHPGDSDAAKTILGRADALGDLFKLVDTGDTVADKIVVSRMDRLAHILIDGIETGKAPGTIATALKTVLADPKWAHMVALTETTRASSAATLTRYGRNGVEAKEWATALDQRVCSQCQANEDQGAIPLTGTFPDGNDAPPGHPLCRCALYPAWLTAQEAAAEGVTVGPALAGEEAATVARSLPSAAGEETAAAKTVPAVQVEIRQVLQDARTSSAVSKAFMAEAERITGRTGNARMFADFQGSAATAREHAEGLLRGLERFPEARLNVVSTVPLKDSSYAQARADGVIQLNYEWAKPAARKDYLDSLARGSVRQEYGLGEQSSWHPVGTGNPTAVTLHEFGHVLDVATLAERIAPDVKALVRERAALGAPAGVPDYVAAKWNEEKLIRHEISQYALKNTHELVAEAFSDVMANGARASQLSREIFDLLEAEYRKGGYAMGSRVPGFSMPAPDLSKLKLTELRALAKQRGLTGYSKLTKPQLLEQLAGSAHPPAVAVGRTAAYEVREKALREAFASAPASGERLSGGISGEKVEKLTLPDGRMLVRKQYGAGMERDIDAEVLAARVLDAVGVDVPAVVRLDDRTIGMEFVEGKHLGQPGVLTAPAAIKNSAEGRALGLGDALIGLRDRNLGNWIKTPDGHIVAIDNAGFLFSQRAAAGNPFTSYLMGKDEHSPWKKAFELPPGVDLRELKAKLQALRPEFQRLGRATWHEQVMERLDQIERRAVPAKAPAPPVKPPAKPPIKTPAAEKPADLSALNVADLRALAKDRGITGYSKMTKPQLVERLGVKQRPGTGGAPVLEGRAAQDSVPVKARIDARNSDSATWKATGFDGLIGTDKQAAEAVTSYLRQPGKLNIRLRFPNDPAHPLHDQTLDELLGYVSPNARAAAEAAAKADKRIAALDRVMAQSPLPQDVVTWRGVAIEHLGELPANLAGHEWTDLGFVSTSTSRDVAEHSFAGGEEGALLRIVAPAGTPALGFEGLGEAELLLGRGLRFRIVADRGRLTRTTFSGKKVPGARLLDVEIVPAGVA